MKINRLFASVFVGLVLLFIGSGNAFSMTIDADDLDITGIDLNVINDKSSEILFGHQSVGGNILFDGGGLQQKYGITVSDFYVGLNEDPYGKINDFVNHVNNGYECAFFKFCYVDIDSSTNVQDLFTDYKNAMDSLKTAYPSVKFVHVTIPLTTDTDTANIKRNEYNNLLRLTFTGTNDYIYDLADIEAVYTVNNIKTRSTFPSGGVTYDRLYSNYTDDGGHLNSTGADRAARGVIKLFATVLGIGSNPSFVDTQPPVISNVNITSITTSSAVITWTTDESADSVVRYGTTASYGSSASNTTLKTSHSITLTGLTADTAYHYQVVSKDASNNTAISGDYTFTTLKPANNPPVDTTSPVITNVSVSNIAYNSVVINWITDEFSDSIVEYGTTTSYGSMQNNTSAVTNHSITLSDLTQLTKYYYRVKSKDSAGNEAVSQGYNFTTLQEQKPGQTETKTWGENSNNDYKNITKDSVVLSYIDNDETNRIWVRNDPLQYGLLYFDLSAIAGKTATNATLRVKIYYDWSIGTSPYIDLHNVEDSENKGMWNESAVTTDYRDDNKKIPWVTNGSILNSISTNPIAKINIRGNNAMNYEVSVDVTGIVKDWSSGAKKNQGFFMKASAGTNVQIYSKETACMTNNPSQDFYPEAPFLEVSYSSGIPQQNQAPVLGTIGNKTVTIGNLLEFTISATDADGDNLTYSADRLPQGATFIGQKFSWAPTSNQAGGHDVTFTVNDGLLTDSETITITVNNINQAPVLGSIGNKTVSEGSTLTFTVSATDPDGDTLTYSADRLPQGATLSEKTFTWTPGTGTANSYPVTFTVSDGSLSDSETITITVGNTNRAPVLATIGNKSVNVSQTLTFTVSASDPDGDVVTVSARGLPGGAAFKDNVFQWKPSSNQTGMYSVYFEVTDGELKDSETIVITAQDYVSIMNVSTKAEDWRIYDSSGTVTNNGDILSTITNEGIKFGIRLEGLNIKDKHYLSMLLKPIDERVILYALVETTDGQRIYLTYSPVIGLDTKTYKWFKWHMPQNALRLFARNLDSDLSLKTGVHMERVIGLYMRGQLDVSEIKFLEKLPGDITFTAPIDSSGTENFYTNVSGSCNKDVDGVMVNGIDATAINSNFISDKLPLVSGINYITAVGYKQSEATAISTIRITVNSLIIPLTGWGRYDGKGTFGLEKNILVMDAENGIGFGITNSGTSSPISGIWNKLTIDIKTLDDVMIYAYIEADNGNNYYLTYLLNGRKDFGEYLFYSVSVKKDNTWQTITRNLDKDLSSRVEGVHVQNIKWFCVRGSPSIGGIRLSKEPVTRADGAYKLKIPVNGSLQNPAWSPDGNNILFTRFRNGYNKGPADLVIYNLKDNSTKTLIADGNDNINLPGSCWNATTGKIVFSSSKEPHDEIYLVDLNSSPIKITNRENEVAYEPSLSPDGQQVVFESHAMDVEDNGVITKYKIDGSGEYIALKSGGKDCRQPNWSPKNNRILYQALSNEQWDIWLMDIDGGNNKQLTNGLGSKTDASFSPDGQQVVYSSDEGEDMEFANLYIISTENGASSRLTNFSGYDGAPSWSPDGKKIAFESCQGDPDNSSGTKICVIEVK